LPISLEAPYVLRDRCRIEGKKADVKSIDLCPDCAAATDHFLMPPTPWEN
jgi:hypothetical protein